MVVPKTQSETTDHHGESENDSQLDSESQFDAVFDMDSQYGIAETNQTPPMGIVEMGMSVVIDDIGGDLTDFLDPKVMVGKFTTHDDIFVCDCATLRGHIYTTPQYCTIT